MEVNENLYGILGLDKTATTKDINRAFRKLSKIHHPDVGGDEETFKKIAFAKEVLSDDKKRANYDAYGTANPRGPHGGSMDMDDIINRMRRDFGFGGFGPFGRPQKQVGRDANVTFRLTLEDVYGGVHKTIKYRRDDKCDACNGEGGHNKTTCGVCNGQGHVIGVAQARMGPVQVLETCRVCAGEGHVFESSCGICGGGGITQKDTTVEVEVPQGVNSGEGLVFTDKGHWFNGGYGRLIVRFIVMPHKVFVRDGRDLKVTIKSSYSDMVLGGKITVSTIEGGKIRATLPEYSAIGDILRIKGKGLPDANTGTRGDMLLILDVEMPTKVDAEERELLEKLRNKLDKDAK